MSNGSPLSWLWLVLSPALNTRIFLSFLYLLSAFRLVDNEESPSFSLPINPAVMDVLHAGGSDVGFSELARMVSRPSCGWSKIFSWSSLSSWALFLWCCRHLAVQGWQFQLERFLLWKTVKIVRDAVSRQLLIKETLWLQPNSHCEQWTYSSD